jgi:hypothetical protein
MTGQLLAAHPNIATIDEAPVFHQVCLQMLQDFRLRPDQYGELFHQIAHHVDPAQIESYRNLYWQRMEEESSTPPGQQGGEESRGGGCQLLIDKYPIHILHLPLINLLFPDSQVIVALRDGRDVCLSAFAQFFRINPMTINFRSWQHTAAFYHSVMDFWFFIRSRLTLPWLEVRYEDTVADLPAAARRMLAFLHMPWSDEVLAFHEHAKKRTVNTPSYVAVTQPVSQRAVGRWKNYETHINEIAPILQPFLTSFGYT